jgi:hypothetical protein
MGFVGDFGTPESPVFPARHRPGFKIGVDDFGDVGCFGIILCD